ncbi:MAG: hypothetical protein RIS70_2289 [Planctomycetota bacterium]
MAPVQPVMPVKLLVAVLWADPQALANAVDRMTGQWGPIDFQGADAPFDMTDYYEPEMGSKLQRRLLAFERLVPPESLVDAKLRCNAWEESDLAEPGGRKVNLDVGYLDHNKVVLASVKFAGQKIHLGQGIYADLVARYEANKYQPFPWTFPDFKTGRYDVDLVAIRTRYLTQLKQFRATPQA